MAQSTGSLPHTSPPWIGAPRTRAPFYVLLAVLLAAVAGILTYRYLGQLRAHTLPSGQVVVAVRGFFPGDQVSTDSVRIEAMPQAIIPDGALTQAQSAIGRVVVWPVSEGEILIQRDLLGEQGGQLAASLPADKWALTLPGSWMAGPLYGVERGDRIDVIAYQAGQPADQAAIVLQSIEILVPPTENENLAVLAVTDGEAIALLYARANGFSLLALLRPAAGS
jgi:Flp pilus assembly protein CpaB